MKKALIVSITINLVLLTAWTAKRIYLIQDPGPNPDYASLHNAELVSLYSNFPITKEDVVLVGNSITERIPIELFSSLKFKNRGIGSNLTKHLKDRIGNIAKGQPKKIFIEIGINDLAHKVPQNNILNNFRAIINTIKTCSPSTLIYVQLLMPTAGSDKYLMPDIIQLNEALKTLQSRHVTLIDMFTPFELNGQMNDKLTTDGTHLNYAGYVKYKAVLDGYI
jgi:lysophospholipase L1-like esterase